MENISDDGDAIYWKSC